MGTNYLFFKKNEVEGREYVYEGEISTEEENAELSDLLHFAAIIFKLNYYSIQRHNSACGVTPSFDTPSDGLPMRQTLRRQYAASGTI